MIKNKPEAIIISLNKNKKNPNLKLNKNWIKPMERY